MLVLAGGRSRRMQRDKRLLALDDDRHLLGSVLEAVVPLARPVFLAAASLDPGRPVLPGVAVLWDRAAHAGPLRALLDASELVGGDLLVVAADMPRLTTRFLHSLLDSAKLVPDAWIALPRTGDLLQPLCALYREAVWPALRERAAAGEASLLDALRTLPPQRVHAWHPETNEALENWNRPEDRPGRSTSSS